MSFSASYTENTGVHKSAVLLAALGTERAARVLSHLDDPRIEVLVREMGRLGHVPAQMRDLVAEEFRRRMSQDAGLLVEGPTYARGLLEQAFGPERANRLMGGQESQEEVPPTLDEMLESTAPEKLAKLLHDEHPQLLALMLGQMTVQDAAKVLAALPAELHAPVAARMARMESPAPMALQHLEGLLREKLRADSPDASDDRAAGPRRVAEILGRMRRSTEDAVLSSLQDQAPTVAEEVNRFRVTFEDLLALDGRSLQRVLREVDADTLRLAMKGLDADRQQVIFSNMSERAAVRLREELENSGPTRLRDVETAQQTIVGIARGLQEKGELQIGSGSGAGSEEEESFV